MDFLAVDMAAQRVATNLVADHGIAPGDRVAILLPDTPEFAFAAYGILWAGAVLFALDPGLDPDALADALATANAKLLIGWHALAEEIEQVSAALELDWLLVEPREFSRLLAATPPRAALVDVGRNAPAVVVGPEPLQELAHAELEIRATRAAHELGLEPGMIINAPSSLSDPLTQIRTLHAAVVAGATVSLAPAVITPRESAWP